MRCLVAAIIETFTAAVPDYGRRLSRPAIAKPEREGTGCGPLSTAEAQSELDTQHTAEVLEPERRVVSNPNGYTAIAWT